MVKRECVICGRRMQFYNPLEARNICSDACNRENRRRQLASPDDGPSMPPLKAENITDDGYINLVKAIVARASHDVTRFKPGTQVRIQAEKFFESEHFNALTGLDGDAVLRDLQKTQKARKRGGLRMRKVLCVETGVEYESINAAAADHNVHGKTLYDALHGRGYTSDGLHWKFVEG